MTKDTAMEFASKYNMEIARHPITRQAWSVYVDSDNAIAELDAMLGERQTGHAAVVTRELFAGTYRYRIVCPTDWFDLYGWK